MGLKAEHEPWLGMMGCLACSEPGDGDLKSSPGDRARQGLLGKVSGWSQKPHTANLMPVTATMQIGNSAEPEVGHGWVDGKL